MFCIHCGICSNACQTGAIEKKQNLCSGWNMGKTTRMELSYHNIII
ncbi:MAG: 4Fe-4S binding protein [Acutalibacteraceae bacterium]